MRKLVSIALSLGLAALLCVHALAAGSAEIVRAFVYDGTLYTYVSMEGLEKPITKAEARVAGQSFQATDRLETVRQAGAPVTWLLLVDNSTSMPAFRQEMEEFSKAMTQASGENTKFILATFGDAFTVVEEDIPAGELAQAVEALPFDERTTRLHTAIGQALDYFEDLPRQRNELRCMVVLTDAVQYDPAGSVSYEELLDRVRQSDVMLHSVGLGEDDASLDSLGRLALASGGLHQVIREQTTVEAAEVLTESSSALFVTGFDLSDCACEGGMETVSVTFASGGELLCRTETEIEFPELTGMPSTQGPSASLNLPGPAEGGGSGAITPPASAPAARKGENLTAALIAAAAVVVLALAVVVVLQLRRKKNVSPSAAAPAGTQEEYAGIYVRMDVLRGKLAGGQTMAELELRNELIIGSAQSCGIVPQDEAIFPQHARLFISRGAVYLEDLHTSDGTKVNGVQLHEPGRLYSGDEISVGNTVLRFKF